MKEEILRLLRSADGYISGQELCNRFGVSRTAVWKAINQLKEAGYEIEAQQNKGYKLMAAPDLMTEAEIKSLMLSLIHISEPTRQAEISYAVFCLKKKKERKKE